MSTTDHANVVVTAAVQIICQALQTDAALRTQLAALVADEIDAAVRRAIHEIRREDG